MIARFVKGSLDRVGESIAGRRREEVLLEDSQEFLGLELFVAWNLRLSRHRQKTLNMNATSTAAPPLPGGSHYRLGHERKRRHSVDH